MEEAQVTAKLTHFVAALTCESLPNEVTHLVKLCILDQIGVQLFGSTIGVSRIARDYATSFGLGPSTICGSPSKAPPELAAFANGVSGHAFELDDYHLPSLNHPGPVVVAPALAVGEEVAANGKAFIESVACGYEIMGRIGRGLGRDYVYGRGFHPVGVLGPLGSAMAAGKLWGLSQQDLSHALGLAASHASGTLEYNQSWGETTRLHAGLGAMGGIRSAALARAGFVGPGSPIAGKYGLARVLSDQCNFDFMVAKLGSVYTVVFNSFKVRPYHGVLHAVVDKALEALGASILQREDPSSAITKVRIGLSNAAIRGLAEGDEDAEGRTTSYTYRQFSLSSPVANALLYGGTLDSVLAFDPDDPKVQQLASKVIAEFDEECEAEWYRGGERGSSVAVRVRIEFENGLVSEAFGHGKGSFDEPVGEDELYGKFSNLASRVLPQGQVDDLLNTLRELELLDDVRELGHLARGHR